MCVCVCGCVCVCVCVYVCMCVCVCVCACKNELNIEGDDEKIATVLINRSVDLSMVSIIDEHMLHFPLSEKFKQSDLVMRYNYLS